MHDAHTTHHYQHGPSNDVVSTTVRIVLHARIQYSVQGANPDLTETQLLAARPHRMHT